MKMLTIGLHIAIVTMFYYIGMWIQRVGDLFIPGSIIGMMLLFVALLTNLMEVTWIDKGSDLLVTHLPLLFIPVTVGVIQYLDVLAGKGMLLLVIVLVSTILVAVTSGAFSQFIVHQKEKHYE
ncbi:CidA/LrgA family protein [Pontibacillus yanchengensis]|uniref:Murein hydrolase transporter LrgA n=1 Tax=Pontibacillus yanchengensis Y32 TaxID=1385514 RepID=A0A0A2T9D6_9BACI|nr:CidA/LrgA family holin-like protein [Pontibacillus yanchengensis]KGP72397.1 murein hydrolase transporter LrgA [Pontibacillus yanchengensis Y32]